MTHKHPPMNSSGEFWWKRKKADRTRKGGEGRKNSVERGGEAEGGRGGGWTSGGRGVSLFLCSAHSFLRHTVCTGK